MTAHTPGPWTAVNDSLIRGPHGEAVAASKWSNQMPQDVNHAANARLIAAAPDGLELAYKVRDSVSCGRCRKDIYDSGSSCCLARLFIQKATEGKP